tara:strand:- start:44 stop:3784 length:3741 start_codon:yes stop_codon:yes gene_type:complete
MVDIGIKRRRRTGVNPVIGLPNYRNVKQQYFESVAKGATLLHDIGYEQGVIYADKTGVDAAQALPQEAYDIDSTTGKPKYYSMDVGGTLANRAFINQAKKNYIENHQTALLKKSNEAFANAMNSGGNVATFTNEVSSFADELVKNANDEFKQPIYQTAAKILAQQQRFLITEQFNINKKKQIIKEKNQINSSINNYTVPTDGSYTSKLKFLESQWSAINTSFNLPEDQQSNSILSQDQEGVNYLNSINNDVLPKQLATNVLSLVLNDIKINDEEKTVIENQEVLKQFETLAIQFGTNAYQTDLNKLHNLTNKKYVKAFELLKNKTNTESREKAAQPFINAITPDTLADLNKKEAEIIRNKNIQDTIDRNKILKAENLQIESNITLARNDLSSHFVDILPSFLDNTTLTDSNKVVDIIIDQIMGKATSLSNEYIDDENGKTEYLNFVNDQYTRERIKGEVFNYKKSAAQEKLDAALYNVGLTENESNLKEILTKITTYTLIPDKKNKTNIKKDLLKVSGAKEALDIIDEFETFWQNDAFYNKNQHNIWANAIGDVEARTMAIVTVQDNKKKDSLDQEIESLISLGLTDNLDPDILSPVEKMTGNVNPEEAMKRGIEFSINKRENIIEQLTKLYDEKKKTGSMFFSTDEKVNAIKNFKVTYNKQILNNLISSLPVNIPEGQKIYTDLKDYFQNPTQQNKNKLPKIFKEFVNSFGFDKPDELTPILNEQLQKSFARNPLPSPPTDKEIFNKEVIENATNSKTWINLDDDTKTKEALNPVVSEMTDWNDPNRDFSIALTIKTGIVSEKWDKTIEKWLDGRITNPENSLAIVQYLENITNSPQMNGGSNRLIIKELDKKHNNRLSAVLSTIKVMGIANDPEKINEIINTARETSLLPDEVPYSGNLKIEVNDSLTTYLKSKELPEHFIAKILNDSQGYLDYETRIMLAQGDDMVGEKTVKNVTDKIIEAFENHFEANYFPLNSNELGMYGENTLVSSKTIDGTFVDNTKKDLFYAQIRYELANNNYGYNGKTLLLNSDYNTQLNAIPKGDLQAINKFEETYMPVFLSSLDQAGKPKWLVYIKEDLETPDLLITKGKGGNFDGVETIMEFDAQSIHAAQARLSMLEPLPKVSGDLIMRQGGAKTLIERLEEKHGYKDIRTQYYLKELDNKIEENKIRALQTYDRLIQPIENITEKDRTGLHKQVEQWFHKTFWNERKVIKKIINLDSKSKTFPNIPLRKIRDAYKSSKEKDN